MRRIIKSHSPVEFEEWKKIRDEENGWFPYWGNFQKPEREIVKESLLEEQGFICCYCGVRINNDSNTEIEHIKPRVHCNEAEKIDYTNFLASCNGGRKDTAKPRETHCNAKRGDEELKITPLDTVCEESFLFTGDGRILAKNDQAGETIKVLGLDITKINNAREAAIRPFLNITSGEAWDIIEKIDARKLDTDGKQKFNEYNFVIINYLMNTFNLHP